MSPQANRLLEDFLQAVICHDRHRCNDSASQQGARRALERAEKKLTDYITCLEMRCVPMFDERRRK